MLAAGAVTFSPALLALLAWIEPLRRLVLLPSCLLLACFGCWPSVAHSSTTTSVDSVPKGYLRVVGDQPLQHFIELPAYS